MKSLKSDRSIIRAILLGITIILMLGSAWLLTQRLDGFHRKAVTKHFNLELLRDNSFVDLKTGGLSELKVDNALIFIFSAGDCPTSLKEAVYWERLNKLYSTESFKVIGILLNTSKSEGKTISAAYGLTFPIYVDTEKKVSSDSSASILPLKLLVKNGNVELSDGPNSNRKKQSTFYETFTKSLELMKKK